MSNSTSFTSFTDITEISERDNVDNSYKKEIIKRVVQFVGLFYLVYGIFVTYIWTSKGLDANSVNMSVINYFWDPVVAVYSMGNVTVFVMILVNKYWSYRCLERLTARKPENHLIVCFTLIPLFIASVIFNIIKLVHDLVIIPCHGYMSFLAPLSTLTLISGAAILIFDIGYFMSCIKDWMKEMMKSHLIFFMLIGIANCLLITVSVQHMKIFRYESVNSSYGNRFKINDTCIDNKHIAHSLQTTFRVCDKYLRPTFILFCVCTLAFLIQPATESKDSDENETDSEQSLLMTQQNEPLLRLSPNNPLDDMDEPVKVVKDLHNASYRLPSASLVICIIFLSLSLLGFIIMYSLRQPSSKDWHNELGSLIYCCFISVNYLIGATLSVVHITEIKRWRILKSRRGNIIDKCLIWVGAGGQVSVALTFVSSSVVLLVEKNANVTLIAMLCMLIVSSALMVTQTVLQTIQISLLLDRNWERPIINTLVESLCPAVGLMGLNMGLLLLSVDQLKSPILNIESNILFIDLFTRELRCVGETLGILQRLHASLLFASMIVHTHN